MKNVTKMKVPVIKGGELIRFIAVIKKHRIGKASDIKWFETHLSELDGFRVNVEPRIMLSLSGKWVEVNFQSEVQATLFELLTSKTEEKYVTIDKHSREDFKVLEREPNTYPIFYM